MAADSNSLEEMSSFLSIASLRILFLLTALFSLFLSLSIWKKFIPSNKCPFQCLLFENGFWQGLYRRSSVIHAQRGHSSYNSAFFIYQYLLKQMFMPVFAFWKWHLTTFIVSPRSHICIHNDVTFIIQHSLFIYVSFPISAHAYFRGLAWRVASCCEYRAIISQFHARLCTYSYRVIYFRHECSFAGKH